MPNNTTIVSHHRYIDANAKSPFNLVRREGKRQIQLEAGTPLSVMILVTSTNFVKVSFE